jgi:multidrug efflux pump
MIPKFFIDRPIFAWVIAIIIVLGGLLALRQLPVASYPPVAPPALAITVNYPGASAKVVEETAVALIEQELNGIENLLYMDSASEQNIGTITLTFQAGTNLDLASVETQNRIKRAEPRLPEEARRLGVTVVKSARNYLMFISLFSPDRSLTTWRSAVTPPPTCWRASAARRAWARPSCSAPSTRCGSGSSRSASRLSA